MLLASVETIRERVHDLRVEIAEISRLNDEYPHIGHSLQVEQSYAERMERLEEILAELKALSGKSGALE